MLLVYSLLGRLIGDAIPEMDGPYAAGRPMLTRFEKPTQEPGLPAKTPPVPYLPIRMGQGSVCLPGFDAVKHKRLLQQVLAYRDNWEFFSYQPDQGELFKSKRDLLRHVQIIPLPVARLNRSRFCDYDAGQDLCSFYTPDTMNVCGLLLRNQVPVMVIIVTKEPKAAATVINGVHYSYGGEFENLKEIFNGLDQPGRQYYFDRTFGSFAYFSGNSSTVWSRQYEKYRSFSTLHGGLDSLKRVYFDLPCAH